MSSLKLLGSSIVHFQLFIQKFQFKLIVAKIKKIKKLSFLILDYITKF